MMRRVSMVLVLSGVLLAAAVPRADVAPFPSWRIASNGVRTKAVQAGSAIYVGGSFTKIGRGVPPFAALLDPVTLTHTQTSGCARRGTAFVPGPYVDYPGGLADGDGPFVVPATAVLARVGPDCRFDRRFHVDLPPGVSIADADDVVELGGRVYFNAYVSDYPQGRFDVYVVEADRTTGALTNAWFMGNGSGVRIAGAAGGHVIVAEFMGATGFTLGWFDTATGLVQAKQSLPNEWSILHVGDTIVTRRSEVLGVRLSAFDAATLDPLPQWPVVHSDNNYFQTFASAGGRLFIAEETLEVDGVAMPRVVAFDAVTGARITGFTAPSWLDGVNSAVSTLVVSGGRLLVFGDFAPGAPRDQAAAFDVTTGALDPWTWPLVGGPPTPLAGRMYFSQITGTDRVARQYLAALDAASGAVLPWSATPPPPSAVTAVTLDPANGWLYAAWNRAVRRFGTGATSAQDATWGMDMDAGEASAMVLSQGALYTTGDFAAVRERFAATTLPREGAAAIAAAGGVTAWRPMIEGSCLWTPRPPVFIPCVSQIVAAAGRIVAQGAVRRLQPVGDPLRTLAAFDATTGGLDGFLPPVAVSVAGIASDGPGLYVVAATPSPALVRVAGAGPALVSPVSRLTGLALHRGRVYADVERDIASGLPTANPKTWQVPVAVSDGIFDIIALHHDIAPIAPRPPENLSAATRGARVTLNWAAGTGDLAPFTPAPPGGTAAMTHIVTASLTPGGPAVATIDTTSPDTTWSVDAPPGNYWLRVAARNQFGTSAPSNEVMVQVSPSAPGPPTAARVVVSGHSVHLEWQAPVGGWPATSYLLDAGTAPGLANLGTLPVNGTTFDAVVPPGRYYVRIRSVNAYGASWPGDEVILDVQ